MRTSLAVAMMKFERCCAMKVRKRARTRAVVPPSVCADEASPPVAFSYSSTSRMPPAVETIPSSSFIASSAVPIRLPPAPSSSPMLNVQRFWARTWDATLAMKVLPLPGGPISRRPRGGRTPNARASGLSASFTSRRYSMMCG
ncbi:MAG: hypothetical protein AVDCRST_MAG88-1191 [uncultured Thermomicrobiales bacterium]|uniref:Uncharacterized protein n=1 Tax=uncultured Thermomicrobiales bacterium TaxID=1645740 RepID=A0A6J4UQL4_9BACT|nr:MAG: hypothetical protein AVDCRST_MAG88-1191 [uncultured Thermomicrobiales bacterium]